MIQWRKFEFKKSSIFKILISEFYRFFSEFILIFTDLILFKKGKKGGYFHGDPRRCDVACKATW